MVVQPPGEVLGDEVARRRPRTLLLVTALVVAALAAGWLVTTGSGGATRLADVRVTDGTAAIASVPAWQAGPDGRPSGPVALASSAVVRRGSSGADPSVVGISGPAVVANSNPAVLVAAGAATTVPLRTVIDCRALPAVIPANAYGLLLKGRPGSKVKGRKVIGAGVLGQQWAAAIRLACASWLARSNLSVTTLSAHVDPTRPRIAVTMKVTNSGPAEASLSSALLDGLNIRVLGRLPIRVPAHGSTDAAFTVVLDRCDSVSETLNETSPLTTDVGLSTQIDLAALSGPEPSLLPPRVEGSGEGFAATGLVLSAAANHSLMAALSRACGGLSRVFTLILPGAVHYDRARRELTVTLTIQVAPGRVGGIQLHRESVRDSAGDPANDYRPLWTSIKHLVPDRRGRVRVTLRYRASAAGPCPAGGAYLPAVVATLDLPEAGRTRIVTDTGTLDLSQDPSAVPLLCGK